MDEHHKRRPSGVAIIAALALAFYVGTLARLYSLDSYAADEIAFFIWADIDSQVHNSSWLDRLLHQPNLAGYGSVYWSVYRTSKFLFGQYAILAMRGLALVAWLSIPLTSILIGNRIQRNLGWAVGLLWMSFPMAWWTGKVSGPEVFSISITLMGVMCLLVHSNCAGDWWRRRQVWLLVAGWLMIGFGLGIKLTAIPVAAFAFVITWCDPRLWSNRRSFFVRISQIGIAISISFLLANPVLLFDRRRFLSELAALPAGRFETWNDVFLTLYHSTWSWDGVYSGGLVHWCMPATGLVFLIGVLMWARWQNALGIMISFAICWAMIIKARSMLGWYWFAPIAVILPGMIWGIQNSNWGKKLVPFLSLLAVLNGIFQCTRIVEEVGEKFDQTSAISELKSLQAEVDKLCQKAGDFDFIIDYAEVTARDGLIIQSKPGAEVVQTSPPYIPQLTPGWQLVQSRLGPDMEARCKLGILADGFLKINQLGERGTEGRRILMIVSKRLSGHLHFGSIEDYLMQRVLPKSPAGTTYEIVGGLPRWHLVVIDTATSAERSPTESIKTKSEE